MSQDFLPLKPGRYLTRNKRIAWVTHGNEAISDGYVVIPRGSKIRHTCWTTRDGKACGRWKCWDIVGAPA